MNHLRKILDIQTCNGWELYLYRYAKRTYTIGDVKGAKLLDHVFNKVDLYLALMSFLHKGQKITQIYYNKVIYPNFIELQQLQATDGMELFILYMKILRNSINALIGLFKYWITKEGIEKYASPFLEYELGKKVWPNFESAHSIIIGVPKRILKDYEGCIME